jgi:hypothetical protein
MDTKASTVVVTSAVGLTSIEENTGLNIYPNPSKGIFTVEMNSTEKTLAQVYNVIGEVVFSKEIISTSTTIDLSTLSEGVYSLKISSASKNSFSRIVIAK